MYGHSKMVIVSIVPVQFDLTNYTLKTSWKKPGNSDV